jgi:hypothetical protein
MQIRFQPPPAPRGSIIPLLSGPVQFDEDEELIERAYEDVEEETVEEIMLPVVYETGTTVVVDTGNEVTMSPLFSSRQSVRFHCGSEKLLIIKGVFF